MSWFVPVLYCSLNIYSGFNFSVINKLMNINSYLIFNNNFFFQWNSYLPNMCLIINERIRRLQEGAGGCEVAVKQRESKVIPEVMWKKERWRWPHKKCQKKGIWILLIEIERILVPKKKKDEEDGIREWLRKVMVEPSEI